MSKIGFFSLALLMLLVQSGCQPPSGIESGHVVYGMSAILDGKPLPALVGITAETCYDGYGGYVLIFSATADMEPQAIDDEFRLGLGIRIGAGS